MAKKEEKKRKGLLLFGGAALLFFMLSRTKDKDDDVEDLEVVQVMPGGAFSKYYTKEDAEHSDTANAAGVANVIPLDYIPYAMNLARGFLDPLSEGLGIKQYVDGWFRSDWLNEEVGGDPDSWHLKAAAVDLDDTRGNSNWTTAREILALKLPFRRMIIYGSLANPTHIHISFVLGMNTGEIYNKTAAGMFPLERSAAEAYYMV